MSLRVSIHPNRISLTPHLLLNHKQWEPEEGTWFDPRNWARPKDESNQNSLANLKVKGNPFIISPSGRKRMQDRIMAMYRLSTPRTIKATGQKLIYNFRCSFVTLTLPSTQMHTDKEIKNLFLNPLLLELRQHHKLENYVWKAELQTNKNIHFHLIFDRFISYYALRRRWNRITNRLGYVDRYSEGMKLETEETYIAKARKYNAKTTTYDLKKRYQKGVSGGWKTPNSVDVRVLKNDKDVAVYLSKYMVKGFVKGEDGEYSKEDEQTLERGLQFGRAWFCSRSLSRLKTVIQFSLSEVWALLDEVKLAANTKEFVGDFFRVYYFRYEELSISIRGFMRGWLMSNAHENEYVYPT